MKKRVVALVLLFVLLFSCCAVFGGCGEKDTRTFEEWMDDFFIEMVGDDPLTWARLADNPEENFHYTREEDVKAEWYSYMQPSEYREHDYGVVCEMLAKLESYDFESLDEHQKLEYRYAKRELEGLKERLAPDCTFFWFTVPQYVSQYGGYVSSFTSTIENSNITTEQMAVDMIDCVRSTTEAFPTYQTYAEDLIANDHALSDYTLDQMIEYLNGILEKGTDYYLYEVFASKVNAADFISEEKKAQYISEFNDAMTNNFLPAVKKLADDLETDKGHWASPQVSYTGKYWKGARDYYIWELKSAMGWDDLDIDNYEKYLYDEYEEAYSMYEAMTNKLKRYQNTLPELYDEINAILYYTDGTFLDKEYATDSIYGCTGLEEMMAYLLELSDGIVKPLKTNPKISFKLADETVQEFASYVAYYATSPYDKMADTEYVTTNPSKLTEATDTFFTLAHEGYPGHLYDHVFEKENNMPYLQMLLGTLGIGEGWAQYAAYAVSMKIASSPERTNAEQFVAEYTAKYNLVNYLWSAYLEFVVNYKMYSVSELTSKFYYPESTALEIIHAFDENVAGYAPYGVGFIKLLDAHKTAKNADPNYNEADFNEYLMLGGMSYGITRLEELVKAYVEAHS